MNIKIPIIGTQIPRFLIATIIKIIYLMKKNNAKRKNIDTHSRISNFNLQGVKRIEEKNKRYKSINLLLLL